MAESGLLKLAWQGTVQVTIGGKDVGTIVENSTEYVAETQEPKEKKKEGGTTIAAKPKPPKRTLKFVVAKEGLEDIPDKDIQQSGDIELTAEGQKPLTWAGATCTISRKWVNEEGTEDTYTCILPTAGTGGGEAGK